MEKPVDNQTPQQEVSQSISPWLVLMSVVCLLVALAICPVISFDPMEVDLLDGGLTSVLYKRNILGTFGVRLGWGLLLTFGIATYPMVLLALISCWRRLLYRKGARPVSWEYVLAFLLFGCGLAMLLGVWPSGLSDVTTILNLQTLPGGTIGQRLCAPDGKLIYLMNSTCAAVFSGLLTIVPLAVIWYFDWALLFQGMVPKPAPQPVVEPVPTTSEPLVAEPPAEPEPATFEPEQLDLPLPNLPPMAAPKHASRRSVSSPNNAPQRHTEPSVPTVVTTSNGTYTLPPVTLLNEVDTSSNEGTNAREIEQNKQLLQNTLDEFGIPADVINAIAGPQVTLFEIKVHSGVRLAKITALEKNFCMALSASSIRILAPIPGKDLVGIEIPNKKRMVVPVYSLMTGRAWNSAKEGIPLLLGRNISGKDVILDLAQAPHLLIAGTTGAGKSVCMNLLIMSLLYRFGPEDMRLIMVDPKVVEFQAYSRLPHLVTPIINEPEKVALALNWAIQEMNQRYFTFARVGAKKLPDYNNNPKRQEDGTPILDSQGNPLPSKLPYIVIIIDELADIMAVAKNEVEKALAIICAKSRAVGIHVIVATQRPDVKVLTGTIKANLPTRIAFRVPSQTDSMTILGAKGAESLLGTGDMLLSPNGGNVERIQCAWVSGEESNRVVEFCAPQAPQCFDASVLASPSSDEDGEVTLGSASTNPFGHGAAASSDAEEELIRQATEIILRDKRPTISYLQRQMGIGYNKAANIIEILEKRGVLGPQIGKTAMRQILISANDFENTDLGEDL
ncbi:MAG: DNA translocase FtsK 4TM domain-containing protein [Victivallales bacterium]|nr:DNA translocase FtsK 4TM domain-containing protein [Victivallales bacterium]